MVRPGLRSERGGGRGAAASLSQITKKASGNTIDLSIVPFVALRQKKSRRLPAARSELMEDADFSFTPLNAWDDKLLDVSDIIETQKCNTARSFYLERIYNNVKKERSYYGVPMKTATVTFHIWQSLVKKAGYRMSDIPNTWDAFIDFSCRCKPSCAVKGCVTPMP